MKMMCIVSTLALLSIPSFAKETVAYTHSAPNIDGVISSGEWAGSEWRPLDFAIISELPESSDFTGSYRMLWDEDYLYLNVRVVDDVLFDARPDPLDRYWDDDTLEIFIDEDASGGEHRTNFNAFAYHVALDGNVADIGPDKANGDTNFVLLNEHVQSRWVRSEVAPYELIWELKIEIHNDAFSLDASTKSSRVALKQGKKLGFMLAYCDNDGSKERESFIGSHPITPVNGDMNLGFKTADVFGQIILKR